MSSDLSLSLIRYAAGATLADHSHERGGVSIVLAGTVEEQVDAAAARGGIGDIVVKPPGIVHRNRFGSSGAVLISIADIPPAMFRGRSWRWFDGRGLARRAVQAAAAIRLGDPEGGAEEIAWELLVAAGAAVPPAPQSGAAQWLSNVRDEVAAGTGRPSVARLARTAGVHPVYLTRLFRRFYGRSISGFVRRLRAERAAELLARSELSVGAIAAQLDFADQSHLCRTFRAELGVAPSAYRALMRG